MFRGRKKAQKTGPGIEAISDEAFARAMSAATSGGFELAEALVTEACSGTPVDAGAAAYLLTGRADAPRVFAFVAIAGKELLVGQPTGVTQIDSSAVLELRISDVVPEMEPALDDHAMPWISEWLGEDPTELRLKFKDRSKGGPASREFTLIIGAGDELAAECLLESLHSFR
jgi:hypothetical protein